MPKIERHLFSKWTKKTTVAPKNCINKLGNWTVIPFGRMFFFFDPIFCHGQNQCVFFYSIWSVHSILLFWQNCFESKQCFGHEHTWIVENTSLLKHSIYYEQTMHENVERETEKKEDRKKGSYMTKLGMGSLVATGFHSPFIVF